MDPAPKRPPNRKRHTKPCMFYQSMQCPFSADECDFAHVIINEDTPHPRPNDAPQANHRTKVCRYFASGSCAQGMWCRFKHPTTDHPDQEETGDIREGGAVFTEGEVNMKKHRRRPSHPMIAVPSIPTGYFPAPEWLPYGHTVGIASQALPPFYIPHNLLSPTMMHDSVESPFALPDTPSSSDQSSTTSDDLVVTMDDLHLSNQATPLAVKAAPPVPTGPPPASTPFYVAPNAPPALHGLPAIPHPYIGHHESQPLRTASRTGRDRSQSQPHSRTKTQSYKTKPCKFYKADSVCPMGEKCTFIHDLSSTTPVHTKQASLGSEMSSSVQSLDAMAKIQHELPQKPVSVHEENRKKGYFPISWRVIGGGVTLGGKRPTCPSYLDGHCNEGDDCKLSHDDADGHADQCDSLVITQDVSDEVSTPPASIGDNAQNGTGDVGLTILLTSPEESNLTAELGFITGDEAALGAGSFMPKATPRQRPISMSIPASPRTDISSLFSSAESPGGL